MRYILLCAFLSFLVTTGAQQPQWITDSLDTYIQTGMHDWNIPGLAVAIVKDGKVVKMKGYGVQDLTTGAPVTENTLFMVASNTKLFTGTALAWLQYDKKIQLDDPVVKYMPDFRLFDPVITNMVTVRDLLTHRIGTKTFQGDFTFWDGTLSRKEIIRKMRLLRPQGIYRQDFGYCNSCYLTAGELIPLLTGLSWEDFIQQRIIQPLGMQHTYMMDAWVKDYASFATPYTTAFTGTLTALPYDSVDNLAPAGSMVSCVKDMAVWLQFQLDSGKYQGQRIIPWQVIKETRKVIQMTNSNRSGFYPTHFSGYGLGVFVSDYNGRQVYHHTGGANGFVSSSCFVPEERLGVVILTNQDNQSLFELLRYQILDAYLGVPYRNRHAYIYAIVSGMNKETADSVKSWQSQVVPISNIPEGKLAGTWTHSLYGTMFASKSGEGAYLLRFMGHKNLTASLEPMNDGRWLLSFNPVAFGIFATDLRMVKGKYQLTIRVNEGLEMDPYVFVKK